MKVTDMTVTALLCVSTILTSADAATKNPEAAERYRVYFGSAATSEQEGIFSSVLDVQTGRLTEARLAVEAQRAGIITLHPAGTHLYSIGKPAGYSGPRSGSVCAYKVDRETGSLTLLNSQESQGTGPSYLLLDHEARNIFVCHYMSGSCAVLPLAEDGSLEPVSSVQQHTGSSVDTLRQNKPHPHAIALDAAGRYVLVTDLGLDQVRIYRFDPGCEHSHAERSAVRRHETRRRASPLCISSFGKVCVCEPRADL